MGVEKNAKREAARAEAKKTQTLAELEAKRSSTIFGLIIGAVILLAIVGVILLRGQAPAGDWRVQTNDTLPIADVEVRPAAVTNDNGILVGQDLLPITLDEVPDGTPIFGIYLDYNCSHCAQFESINIDEIREILSSGTAVISFHPVAIMDSSTANRASTRLAATAAFISDAAPEHFLDWHIKIFDIQPQGAVANNLQLANIAREIGIPEDVAIQIEDGSAIQRYAQWVASATTFAITNSNITSRPGNFGTPTLTVNGIGPQLINWTMPGSLTAGILAAVPDPLATASRDVTSNTTTTPTTAPDADVVVGPVAPTDETGADGETE